MAGNSPPDEESPAGRSVSSARIDSVRNRINRRRFIRAAGAAGVAGLAGCLGEDEGDDGGDNDSDDGGDDSDDAGGGVEVDDDVDILLECRTLFTGGDGEAFENIVRDFNDEHDKISVEVQRIPWDEYYDQMFTSMTGGNPPDLGIFHAAQLVQFAETLEPIEDVDMSPYAEGARDGRLVVDGTQVALPMDFLAQAMYYNKDIFEEAGLDPEDTPDNDWDNFVETVNTIRDAGYEQSAFDPGGGGFGATQWMYYLYQRGGQVIQESGDSWEAAFNNEAGLGAMEPFADMVEPWNWMEAESSPAWEKFVQGDHGIIMDGTWAYSRFKEGGGEELDFDWGIFKPLQAPGKEQDAVTSGSHTLAVPQNPDRSEEETQAAKDAIEWITQNTYRWATESGHMVAATEVAESDEVRNSDAWEKTLSTFNEMAENDVYVNVPPTQQDDEYSEAINANWDAVRFGEKEPQAALDDAERRVNQAFGN